VKARSIFSHYLLLDVKSISKFLKIRFSADTYLNSIKEEKMDTKPRQTEDGIEILPWKVFLERL